MCAPVHAGDQGEQRGTYTARVHVRVCVCVRARVFVFLCASGGVCITATMSVSTLWKKNEQFVSPHHFTNEISAVRRWINIIRKARVGH